MPMPPTVDEQKEQFMSSKEIELLKRKLARKHSPKFTMLIRRISIPRFVKSIQESKRKYRVLSIGPKWARVFVSSGKDYGWSERKMERIVSYDRSA